MGSTTGTETAPSVTGTTGMTAPVSGSTTPPEAGAFPARAVVGSTLCGALLLAKASHVGPPYESLLFLILLCAGVIAQSGRHRGRKPGVDAGSRS